MEEQKMPQKDFQAEYQKLIEDDISKAQAQLEQLPEKQRRGLTLETLRHFGCGYIPDWVLTKRRAENNCGLYTKQLPPPSERIIVPTSNRQFLAAATQRARQNLNKDFWKQHAGAMQGELFNLDAAREAKIIVVVEGEFDAMSIHQATQGIATAVAILGCNNWKKTLLPRLNELQSAKFILLFDADDSGRKSSEELRQALIGRNVPAISRTLYDVLDPKIKQQTKKKIDANDLLIQHGEEFLLTKIQRIIRDADAEFERVEKEIAQRRADLIENNRLAAENPPVVPVGKSLHQDKADTPATSTRLYVDDPTENQAVIVDVLAHISPRQLTRDDWFCVGTVMKRYGFSLEDFQNWSKDDSRYDADSCRVQWDSIKTADELNDTGNKLGTLIYIAKQYGYNPPPKKNAPIPPQVSLELQSAREYVDDLTDENFNPDDVNNLNVRRKIALLDFYDPPRADKFFKLLNAHKDAAPMRPYEFRREINRIVTQIRSEQKAYDRECAQAEARKERAARREKDRLDRWVKKRQSKPKHKEYDLTTEQVDWLFTPPNTDLDNARRLAYVFSDKIKFLRDSDRWLTFSDKEGIWQRGNAEKISSVLPFAGKLAMMLEENEPSPADYPDAEEIVNTWRSNARICAAINLLKGANSIRISTDDLDNHRELLNCLNGVVDLQTGKFYETVDPKLLITQKCAAEYRKDYRNEQIEKFLRDIFPDEQTRAAMIRWLGYCLTGEVREEKALMGLGNGGNGKGTLTTLLMKLFNDYATSVPVNAVVEAGRFKDAGAATPELNCLEKRRLGIVEELPQGGRLDVAKFKLLTGGDKLPVRRLYEEFHNITPTHKIFLSGNHLPVLSDTRDTGLLRRLLNVHFSADFTKNPDLHLKEKLLTPDALSGMLSLLVDAAQEWYSDGLIISDAMKAATAKYLADNDFISDFIENYCHCDERASIDRQSFLRKIKAEYPSECLRFTDRALIEAVTRMKGIEYRRTKSGYRIFGVNLCTDPDATDKFFQEEPIDPDDVPDTVAQS